MDLAEENLRTSKLVFPGSSQAEIVFPIAPIPEVDSSIEPAGTSADTLEGGTTEALVDAEMNDPKEVEKEPSSDSAPLHNADVAEDHERRADSSQSAHAAGLPSELAHVAHIAPLAPPPAFATGAQAQVDVPASSTAARAETAMDSTSTGAGPHLFSAADLILYLKQFEPVDPQHDYVSAGFVYLF